MHVPAPPESPSPTQPTPSPPISGKPKRRLLRLPQSRRQWLFLLGLAPLVSALFGAVAGVGVAASIRRPQVETVDQLQPRVVTNLFDRDHDLFQTYARERRILLDDGEIPPVLRDAILAIEDAGFFEHGPISLRSGLRALRADLREGRFAEGASTITMQVARSLFLTRKKTLRRKLEEILLAVELEKRFSKEQILTMYCNVATNLSQGNYGMEAGARSYFNKSVRDLTLAEAATLAGIPQQPTYHNVYARPEAVRRRRDVVLDRMLAEGFITPDQHAAARAEPLLVAKRRRTSPLGAYFAEDVRRYLASAYGTTALYDEGLRVHTTLDATIQRAAEAALRDQLLALDHGKGWQGAKDHLDGDQLESVSLPSWRDEELVPGPWYEGIVLASGRTAATVKIGDRTLKLRPAGIAWTRKARPSDLLRRGDVAWFRLQASEDGGESILMLEQEPAIEGAVVVLESATGAVRAMVGGWDYGRSEFNRVTQTRRQVGSAFKAFVYGAALENGFTPADTLFDGPVAFAGADNRLSYAPRNDQRRYFGITTLRRALEQSINVTSVKLLDVVGVERVIAFARRCGIESELPPYPTLALGAASVRPLELAAAYAAIANRGIYVAPYTIQEITTRDGRILEQHLPRAQQAMDPAIAYVLTRMLRGVALHGTAARGPHGLMAIPIEVAGKTGTTDTATDAWFAGITPRYTLLSWVGYDRPRSLGRGMSGGRAALPIVRALLDRGLEDGWLAAGETFPMPPGVVEVEIEPLTGLVFGPGAERTVMEAFVAGTEPEQQFDPHRAFILGLPWYLQEPFYLPKEGERMPSQISDWTAVKEAWQQKDER